MDSEVHAHPTAHELLLAVLPDHLNPLLPGDFPRKSKANFPGKLGIPLCFNRLGRVPQFFSVGISWRRVDRQHHLGMKKLILFAAVVLVFLVILTEELACRKISRRVDR